MGKVLLGRSNSVLLWLIAVFVLVSMVGCNPQSIIEPTVYAHRGGWSQETEFEFIKPSIDQSIQRELAGGESLGFPNWKAYWRERYKGIRSVHEEPAQTQRYINYIHQQRKLYSLPLYDI